MFYVLSVAFVCACCWIWFVNCVYGLLYLGVIVGWCCGDLVVVGVVLTFMLSLWACVFGSFVLGFCWFCY